MTIKVHIWRRSIESDAVMGSIMPPWHVELGDTDDRTTDAVFSLPTEKVLGSVHCQTFPDAIQAGLSLMEEFDRG